MATIGVLLPFLFFGFVGLVVALVVFLGVSAHRRNKERLAGIAHWAAARGYQFAPDGRGLEARFSGAPFGKGYGRTVSQVVEGRFQGWPFVAFDYQYTTPATRQEDRDTTSRFSVVSMHLGTRAPMLQVRPQSSFGRFFSDSFGGGDFRIGFPVFDDAFHISTDSPEFTLEVLTPQVCELLLATRERAWRFQGDSLLLFRSGSHSAAEAEHVLGQMAHLLTLVPAPVWAKLRGERPISDAPIQDA